MRKYDWSKINDITFEEMAYDYMSANYPNINWQKTKQTWDGNRDGESNLLEPMNITIKYWYEAKYSRHTDKAIQKARLDSTLVSSILDGHVVLIAFITNSYISEDYQRRATTFSRQRDNLTIYYINGEQIEAWISSNKLYEKKYFGATGSPSHITLESHIKACTVLEEGYISSENYSKVNNIEIGKDYILHISFFSCCKQRIQVYSNSPNIEFVSNDNRRFDDPNSITVMPGDNSFFIPIRFCLTSDNDNQNGVGVYANTEKRHSFFSITGISLYNVYKPEIIHSSQIRITSGIFNMLRNPINVDVNIIIWVTGDAGMGKSHLQEELLKDNLNPFSSYVISFSGDDLLDVISCYKLIIYSLYGEIWSLFSDYSGFNTIESEMISQIINGRVEHETIANVTSFYRNTKDVRMQKKSISQIFVDDYHKLSQPIKDMLKAFFQWFLRQTYSCRIILFSRPIEDSKFFTKEYIIEPLTYNDVEITLMQNQKNMKESKELIKKYPLPLNLLHFSAILTNIHELSNAETISDSVEIGVFLNNIFKSSVTTTVDKLGNEILKCYYENNLVSCIYIIRTGLPLDAIAFYGEEGFDEVYELLRNRIIKEINGSLFPFHDILLKAFDDHSKHYNKAKLVEFLEYARDNKYISEGKFLGIIMELGGRYFFKYFEEAKIYRNELHKSGAYYEALRIAAGIEKSLTKHPYDYTYDNCWNLFVKANSIKFIDSHETANEVFGKIEEIYKNTSKDEIKGIYLEAKTEIVNNNIWMMKLDVAKSELVEIESLIASLYNNHEITDTRKENALLNFYNRRMFLRYMLDIGTVSDYTIAYGYADELHRDDYKVFAQIDYAKCIYVYDLGESLAYITKALDQIQSLNEPRRELDIKSERWFVESLQKHIVDNVIFNELCNIAKEKNYIHSLSKLKLKDIFLRIYLNISNSKEIIDRLERLVIETPVLVTEKRLLLFVNHLYAAACFSIGDFEKTRLYSQKCVELTQEMGDSYKNVHIHNSRINNKGDFIVYSFNTVSEKRGDQFFLDPRLW